MFSCIAALSILFFNFQLIAYLCQLQKKVDMAFFSLPGTRRFNYKPLFYNEQDEKRRERHERIEREVKSERGESNDEAPNFIHFARKQRQKSSKRVLIIFLALAAVYFYLQQRFLR